MIKNEFYNFKSKIAMLRKIENFDDNQYLLTTFLTKLLIKN